MGSGAAALRGGDAGGSFALAGGEGEPGGGVLPSSNKSTSSKLPVGTAGLDRICEDDPLAGVACVGCVIDVAGFSSDQSGGALISTIAPHLGHARIFPTIDGSRTFRRALQVVQGSEKSSTTVREKGSWEYE